MTDHQLSKKKIAAIAFLLVLGSVSWSTTGILTALGYGLGGRQVDLEFFFLGWPYYINYFLETNFWIPYIIVPTKIITSILLGTFSLLVISLLPVFLIKKFLGNRYVLIYSIIFGLLPIVASLLLWLFTG